MYDPFGIHTRFVKNSPKVFGNRSLFSGISDLVRLENGSEENREMFLEIVENRVNRIL